MPATTSARTSDVCAAVVLLLATTVLAVAGGLAGSLGVAALVARPSVFLTAGLAVVGLTAFAVGGPVLRRFGSRSVSRAAGYFATTVTAMVAAATLATVLWPGPVYLAPADPPGVRFWDLSTGSRIAYTHRPATGVAFPAPVVFLHGGPRHAGSRTTGRDGGSGCRRLQRVRLRPGGCRPVEPPLGRD